MRALITGIGGQDGAYLCTLLAEKDYEIFGTVHQGPRQYEKLDALDQRRNIEKILGAPSGHKSGHNNSVKSWIHDYQFDEIYNLAAHSSVAQSFNKPARAHQSAHDFIGILDAVREYSPHSLVFQASSCEMFGYPGRHSVLQSFSPLSPYGCSKLYAHNMANIYRKAYGVFVACGILFNHESVLRKPHFIMRKITRHAARMAAGFEDSRLSISAPGVSRDWGYAPDYVEAMWMMLQHPSPLDLVIATGEEHTVREIVTACASRLGMSTTDILAPPDATLLHPQRDRPIDVPMLCGDPSHADIVIGWEPTVRFDDLVGKLLRHDVQEAKNAKHR